MSAMAGIIGGGKAWFSRKMAAGTTTTVSPVTPQSLMFPFRCQRGCMGNPIWLPDPLTAAWKIFFWPHQALRRGGLLQRILHSYSAPCQLHASRVFTKVTYSVRIFLMHDISTLRVT